MNVSNYEWKRNKVFHRFRKGPYHRWWHICNVLGPITEWHICRILSIDRCTGKMMENIGIDPSKYVVKLFIAYLFNCRIWSITGIYPLFISSSHSIHSLPQILMRTNRAILTFTFSLNPRLIKFHHTYLTDSFPADLLARQRHIDRINPIFIILGRTELTIIPYQHFSFS